MTATNTSAVRGFYPVGHLLGVDWNAQLKLAYIPSSDGTAVFKGDPVKLAGSGDGTSAGSAGCPTVTQCAAGATAADVFGIAWGFDQYRGVTIGSENKYRTYRPASTGMYCLVLTDPYIIYACQEDGVGNSLTNTDIGLNVDIIVASGSTSTGFSGVMLDSSTHATTNTLPWTIVGFANTPDNVIGAVNSKVLVRLNQSAFSSSLSTGR